jgi:hypothetical protein
MASKPFVPTVTLTRALTDPAIFGKTFRAPSFWPWRVIGKLIDGLPLTEQREIDLYRQCTGRTTLPTKPVRRWINYIGRRGGKDRFKSAVAVWRAALATDWNKHISPGEQACVILLGGDRKQASILSRYCTGLLRVPLLAAEITRQTNDVIEFRNGGSLEIVTNNASLVRGRSAVAVLGSECAHWRTDEFSSSSDEEVVGAAEPSMAMCPDQGILMLGSSVYRKRGYMYRKYRELFGNDDADDDTLCWFAPSTVMNPKLPQEVIDRALAEDAPKARAEYLGIFREDISDFLPIEIVEACTDVGVYERPYQPGKQYYAWADAAGGGGTGRDSFALAITHKGDDGLVYLDVIRERKPPFVPAAVIAEWAPILKQYRIAEVHGDAWGGGFHSGEWNANVITFAGADNTTSENYLAALSQFLAGRFRLLDNVTLRNQLTSLERTVGSGDHEKVEHPKHANAHDDVATATCGALVLASQSSGYDVNSAAWQRAWLGVDPDDADAIAEAKARAAREQYHQELLGRFGQPISLNFDRIKKKEDV